MLLLLRFQFLFGFKELLMRSYMELQELTFNSSLDSSRHVFATRLYAQTNFQFLFGFKFRPSQSSTTPSGISFQFLFGFRLLAIAEATRLLIASFQFLFGFKRFNVPIGPVPQSIIFQFLFGFKSPSGPSSTRMPLSTFNSSLDSSDPVAEQGGAITFRFQFLFGFKSALRL